MGLGLAIVKNIVDNFSGRVWLKPKRKKNYFLYGEIPIWEEALKALPALDTDVFQKKFKKYNSE